MPLNAVSTPLGSILLYTVGITNNATYIKDYENWVVIKWVAINLYHIFDSLMMMVCEEGMVMIHTKNVLFDDKKQPIEQNV